jgi:lipid II isoglutaminyl synthase (glutamine-hydrolysing)
MGLSGKIRCKTAKLSGKLAKHLVKVGSGMGKSFPGYLYLKIGSSTCLKELAKQPRIGSIIVTGTNGKTTTTKLTSMFLEKDTTISYNYDSNTLNAITTGLLSNNIDLGVFEYGIRDLSHAIPDEVCRLVQPVGVVYTNVSREHSIVAGISNPFDSYLNAKELLSAPMKRGILICNADDPRTAYIGKRKEKDTHVTYFGMEIDLDDETSSDIDVSCPMCLGKLEYIKRYSNHRGLFKCSCGFERPEPDLRLTDITKKFDEWTVRIEGNLYNYPTNSMVPLILNIKTPAFGLYNLYNLLSAVTTYASFTPKPGKIENTVKSVSKTLDITILPPGRFELMKINDKLIGMGQGDNGDALKANIQFMEDYIEEDDLEFIYTTPDEDEDDIFEDHLKALISSNPKKVYVIPGRTSVKAGRGYYKKIREFFDAEFYPLAYTEMEQRRKKIIELIHESPYRYTIVSGCGPEHNMWAELKSELKRSNSKSF